MTARPSRGRTPRSGASSSTVTMTCVLSPTSPRPPPGTGPSPSTRIEWFASPADVCRAFASLEKLAEALTGATVSSILAMNPGVMLDRRVFSYVGYKGGSEPGVLTLAGLLRRAVDGQWVVVTVGFADPVNPIDETAGTYYAIAAAQMAAR